MMCVNIRGGELSGLQIFEVCNQLREGDFMMWSENSTKTDELNWKKKGIVQQKQEKNYPDWKERLFVEKIEVSCWVAEIKGREDF